MSAPSVQRPDFVPDQRGASERALGSPPRWTREEERDFRQSLAVTERQRLIWGLGAAVLMWGLFGSQDGQNFPGQQRITLPFRVGTELVVLVLWVLCFRLRGYHALVWTTFVGIGTTGVATMLICHFAGGQEAPFATVLLIQVFAATLSTMPLWMMALLNGLILAAYALPLLRYPEIHRHSATHALFQITGAGVAAALGSVMRWRLARQEFRGRVDLSRSNAELHTVQALKDQMFQNLSHEFRTPLTLILAPLERWLGHPERLRPEELQGYELIRRNALRLLNLINDLLDLARLSAGEDGAAQAPLLPESITGLLRKLAEDVAPLAQRKEVQFEASLPEGPVVYRVDAIGLEKMVLNLLSNALKFTPRGGKVTLSAAEDAEGLAITVQDTGIGIPAEAHARIFERFRQVDGTTTRRYGGSGVGLALVAELARQQGYTLGLTSAPGEGSIFWLRLPLDKRAALGTASAPSDKREFTVELARRAAFAGLSEEAPHEGVRSAGVRGPRVLLAEDDPELNHELMRLLAPNYRIRSVSDGQLAYDEALREPPDVLLSDVMMPGRDGVTLARTLREVPALRNMAIVLLSARASLDDRVRGREVGIDTYLTKPFNPRELIAALEGLLRSRMRVVGSYLLDRRLGQGGQGDVYLAEHLQTSAIVALKMLSPSLSVGPNATHWLEVEQQALSQLSHPNIVRILEQGRQENRFFLVMEHLVGSTLSELRGTEGVGFGFGNTAAVGHALCGALSAVHQLGLVHRDVKCENVMILAEGGSLESRVRLIDFGIVLDLKTPSDSNATAGTLSALAPELFKGATPSAASDQFALGAALYLLAAGRHPFARGSRGETIGAILAGAPTPLAEVMPTVPPALAAVIERALRTDPAERYSSLAEMGQSLAPLAIEAELPMARTDDDETGTSASPRS